ncbi:MAG: GNAT family N-acetyltransferase [Mycobacterium sp.]|nr:GNAT family N-acetyltransferase [Mycobacterium sp.]
MAALGREVDARPPMQYLLESLVNIKVQDPFDGDQVEALVSLGQRAWVQAYRGLALHRDTGAPLTLEECHRFVNTRYRRRMLGHWTTMPGENVVRLVTYAWNENASSCTDHVVGYLEFHGQELAGFYVDPLFQGRGYGRRLLEAALMLGFGDRPITVQTTRDSDAHRLVYPALGFIPTNREVPPASSTGNVGPSFTLHQVELIRPANARADM